MTLKNLKTRYHQELIEIYTPSEIAELFSIFVEKVLGWDKLTLYLHLGEKISSTQKENLLSTLSKLKTGKPYQYILGQTIFFGNIFFVNEHTLIPRPETEELTKLIISKLENQKERSLKILDIGTGSGCIPITLAKYLPNAQITSIEISEKALEVAKKNANFHQVKIQLTKKDYLRESLDDIYDIIVSNPPYIDTEEENEIPFSVKNFEPNIALFAPQNLTLAFYEKIAQDAEKHLSPNGFIFLEINQKLGQETLNLFKKFSENQLLKDLSKNERFIISKK